MSEIERERRTVELLGEALKLRGPERQQFLDEACADDPELREELETMLSRETAIDDFLEVPAVADLGREMGTAESRPAAKQEGRLLVVDDNELNREIMSRQLRRQGFEVVTADGGAKGLEIVASRPVDLVVLDIMMPGIDGIEVLRRLRREYSPAELPIIMATARSDSPDIVLCAELGANDHVAKPLDFDVLTAKVRALLRLKAAATPARPASQEPTHGELRPGSLLAGRYLLGEKIGLGSFGAVYKARHQKLDSDVAIKILKPRLSDDESLERFRQEGVAACRVRHPNAVAVSDFGVSETGVAYLVMELLEGVSLDVELRERGRFSPRRMDEILQPICDVLAEAHEKHLVHRDIKPGNIFLHQTPRGEIVKVLDFGIAKILGRSASQGTLTAAGWFVGTPAYTAPERLNNFAYDGRADVYSLGVMAFEMLTGQRPFRGSKKNLMSIMKQHTETPPPTLRSIDPDLPASLEEPISWALAKDPSDRPDAASFARALAKSVREGGAADAGERSEIRKKTEPQTKAETRAKTREDPETETEDSSTVSRRTQSTASSKMGRWWKRLKGS